MAICVMVLAACSPEASPLAPEDALGGGVGALVQRATVDESPFASHLCGALLVDPSVAITAAHCVANRSATDLAVRFNSGDLCDPRDLSAIVVDVVAVTVSGTGPDLAELTLRRDVQGLATATLSTHEPASGLVWAAGWGSRTSGDDFGCDLKVIALRVVPTEDCESAMWGVAEKSTKGVFCAVGAGNGNTCAGDSGSPVFTRQGGAVVAVGMVLGGTGCDSSDPGIYLDLSRVTLSQTPPQVIRTQGAASSSGCRRR